MSSPSRAWSFLVAVQSCNQGLNLKIPKQRLVVTVAAKHFSNFFRSGSLDVVETESIWEFYSCVKIVINYYIAWYAVTKLSMHFTFAFYHFDAINNKLALWLKSLPARQNDSNGRLQLLTKESRPPARISTISWKKSKFLLMYFLHFKTSYTVKRREEVPTFFEVWQNIFL